MLSVAAVAGVAGAGRRFDPKSTGEKESWLGKPGWLCQRRLRGASHDEGFGRLSAICRGLRTGICWVFEVVGQEKESWLGKPG